MKSWRNYSIRALPNLRTQPFGGKTVRKTASCPSANGKLTLSDLRPTNTMRTNHAFHLRTLQIRVGHKEKRKKENVPP